MRHLTRLSIATLLVLGLSASHAFAATTAAQLVELSKAGLGDDILIALIQTDGSTFQLTAADILSLHAKGLSDKVILAMQETAKKVVKPAAPPTTVEPPAPADPSVAQDLEPVAPIVQRVPPADSTVVNVYQTVTQRVESPRSREYYSPNYSVPIMVPVYVRTPVAPKPVAPPVYWGFGGQKRPDSWTPDPNAPPETKNPGTSKTPGGKGGGS